MATVERWERVESEYSFVSPNTVHVVTVGEDCLDIQEFKIHTVIALPDDIRLCRLVTVQVPDAVAMPDEVRLAIREALEYTKEQIWENEEPWDAALLDIPYGEALKWLSSQERSGGDGAS